MPFLVTLTIHIRPVRSTTWSQYSSEVVEMEKIQDITVSLPIISYLSTRRPGSRLSKLEINMDMQRPGWDLFDAGDGRRKTPETRSFHWTDTSISIVLIKYRISGNTLVTDTDLASYFRDTNARSAEISDGEIYNLPEAEFGESKVASALAFLSLVHASGRKYVNI